MTKICRLRGNRLGILQGDQIAEVTPALDVLPQLRWPLPHGDQLIAHLPEVLAAAEQLLPGAQRIPLDQADFLSPVANPSKIIGAPVNYRKHQDEANADGGVNFESDVKDISHYGLFLKANSSLVGVSEGVRIADPARRVDHEVELVVVIGRSGRNIDRAQAFDHVAGYASGLDMTVRGPEDRSLRKSLDTFSVLGPWLTTLDEVPSPDALGLWLDVNGTPRQRANTRDLIYGVARLIEYASERFTLLPGDLIYTGTPEGVGQVTAGDVLDFGIELLGETRTTVL